MIFSSNKKFSDSLTSVFSKFSKKQEKDFWELTVHIRPTGDRVAIELKSNTRGREIKNHLIERNLIPLSNNDGDVIVYQLISEKYDIVIDDYKSLNEIGELEHDTLFLMPISGEGIPIKDNDFVPQKILSKKNEGEITIRILPSGNEVVVEIGEQTTGKTLKDVLINNEFAPSHGSDGYEINYNLISAVHNNLIKDNEILTLYNTETTSDYLFLMVPSGYSPTIPRPRISIPNSDLNTLITAFSLPKGGNMDIFLDPNTKIKAIKKEYVNQTRLKTLWKDMVIINKRQGVKLLDSQSMAEANVENGDTIILMSAEDFEKYNIGKKITHIPNEVLNKGINSVLSYAELLEKQAPHQKPQKLNECKLIFIGSGDVGKTSLIKRLVEGKFNPYEEKTDGIEITKWYVKQSKNKINLNVWDFGGQEIMHTTHKFFMTRRSLYVLVINPRAQDRHTSDIELEYWLKLISSFAGISPIIIAINKSEVHKMDLAKGALSDRFPQISGFVETSCKYNTGIDTLKEMIIDSISNLKHVDDIIPVSYLRIKEKLEQTNEDYLHYSEYINLCKEIAPDLSEEDLEILVQLLNDLGIMLNISENRHLRDTQVLNPEWITNGVYKVINSRQLIENKGLISEEEITAVLDSRYPTNKERGFIMDMMNHFELCYQIPHRKFTYFVPGAFPKDKPDSIKWHYDNCLHFHLQYDMLPTSIISRFLVKMHHCIDEDNYWRQGALIKDSGNVALIEALPFERKVVIKVASDADCRMFLKLIRREFEAIHQSISRIEVESLIALEGNILVSYDALLNYEKAGVKEYFEPKTMKKYSVKRLLNGVENRANLENLRLRVSKGQIGEVLEDLILAFPKNNEIVALQARYNQIKMQDILGKISTDNKTKEENKIVSATLEIIDILFQNH